MNLPQSHCMKRKKCKVTRRKELFYYVTSGSSVTRDVHWCITVDYQQIENGNIAHQIHGFTIDYGKFVLMFITIHRTLDSFLSQSKIRKFLCLVIRCWQCLNQPPTRKSLSLLRHTILSYTNRLCLGEEVLSSKLLDGDVLPRD